MKVWVLTRGGLFSSSRSYERVAKVQRKAEMSKRAEQKSALIVVPVSKRRGRVKRQKPGSSCETGTEARKAENLLEDGTDLQKRGWKPERCGEC